MSILLCHCLSSRAEQGISPTECGLSRLCSKLSYLTLTEHTQLNATKPSLTNLVLTNMRQPGDQISDSSALFDTIYNVKELS